MEMKKLLSSICVVAFAMTCTTTIALANTQPTHWIDNDTSSGLPYKTWSDYVVVNGVNKYTFTKDANLMDPVHDFHNDSEIAQASPTSIGASTNASYHWDLPTGSNTVMNYNYYIYLKNAYFTNPMTLYTIDLGYSTAKQFYVNQYTAPTDWNSYGSVSTYGTAHLTVVAHCFDGSVQYVSDTGADGVGLQ